MRRSHWYSYFWVWTILYFALGLFNILFAWLGMIDFLLPLLLALFGGDKWFCNYLCGRGQLFSLLPRKLPCSRGARTAPKAAGDSSLNLENNFELLAEGWGHVNLSYFRFVVNLETARALFAQEERRPPPHSPRGTVRASE